MSDIDVAPQAPAVSKRVRANRRNALKSTGPRTVAGKAMSSRNAVKHGLFVGQLLIEDADEREAFTSFAREAQRRFRPADAVEQMLIDRFVAAAWRMRRTQCQEAAALQELLRNDPTEPRGTIADVIAGGNRYLDNLLRYERGFEGAMYRALNHLLKIRQSRRRRQEQEDALEEEPPCEPNDGSGENEPIAAEGAAAPTCDAAEACAAVDPAAEKLPCKNEPNSAS